MTEKVVIGNEYKKILDEVNIDIRDWLTRYIYRDCPISSIVSEIRAWEDTVLLKWKIIFSKPRQMLEIGKYQTTNDHPVYYLEVYNESGSRGIKKCSAQTCDLVFYIITASIGERSRGLKND